MSSSRRNASASSSNQVATSSKVPLRKDNNNNPSNDKKPFNKKGAIESDEEEDQQDSDSDEDDLPLPKFEKVQEEYLNQVIDKGIGAAKLKVMSAEMSVLKKSLKEFSDSLTEAAAELATNRAYPEEEIIDMNNLPEDLVSNFCNFI